MAYIFRLPTEGGKETGDGWTVTQQYDNKAIDSIRDPQVGESRREITSIPSPFARFDLVRTAFEWVAKSAESLEGTSVYHKLVSDALDLGQILFKYNYFAEDLSIECWTKEDLDRLAKDGEADLGKQGREKAAHQQLKDTLEIFMEQDSDEFNFRELNRLFFLRFKGVGAVAGDGVLLGGTSPLTLFVTPANDLEFVGKTIRFVDDIPFDEKYRGLHRRDFQYVKYIFALRQALDQHFKRNGSEFVTHFKEIEDYLERVRKELRESNNKAELESGALEEFYQNECVSLKHSNGESIELFGVELKCQRFTQDTSTSDFQIRPTRSKVEFRDVLPLVLSNYDKESCENWHYYGGQNWKMQDTVPYSVDKNLNGRRLPGVNVVCPWLATSDFLTDTLVKQKALPGRGEDFLYAGLADNANAENTYCLPLKPRFFEYFTAESLVRGQDGDPKLKLTDLGAGQIKAELRIPVKRGYITFVRNYSAARTAPDVSADSNSGAIDVYGEAGSTVAFHPAVKFGKNEDAKYRVLLASLGRNEKSDVRLEFYGEQGRLIDSSHVQDYQRINATFRGSVYSVEGANIEAIRLITPRASGMIIPRMVSEESNGRTFSFAVDFGTSNTHIAYKRDDGAASAFDILSHDQQLKAWHRKYEELERQQLVYDSLPEEVGSKVAFSFPLRTALAKLKNKTTQKVFATGQVSFGYEHFKEQDYLSLVTNLKWGSDTDSRADLKCYIASLCWLMRSKVLLNGGSLSKTKIVWFYPHSMKVHQQDELAEVWRDCYRTYFGGTEDNDSSLVEAVAPYWYFRQTNSGLDRSVNVDIGGGTVDVSYSEGGELRLVSSFRFGANNIYGINSLKRNPLLEQFVPKAKSCLENCKESDWTSLNEVLEQLNRSERENSNPDLASFFFTLERRGIFDFTSELRANGRFRLLFLFYYSAVLYHVFYLLKAKGYSCPRYISFSGNGSKILSIIFAANRSALPLYTQSFAAKIFGIEEVSLDLVREKEDANPKILTSLGGLYALQSGDSAVRSIQVRALEYILVGDDEKHVLGINSSEKFTYGMARAEKGNVLAEVRRFVDFFLSIDSRFQFNDNFDVKRSDLDLLKSCSERDLDTYFDNGLREVVGQSNEDEQIAETLFFYPICGILENYTKRAVEAPSKE